MSTEIARKGVVITDPETMEQFSYVPGDEVPEEHVELIDEKRREKIFGEQEEEFTNEDGEVIVTQPNGNLAFDEDGADQVPPSERAWEDMTVPELRKYASVAEIDVSGLTKKDDLIARIQEVEAEREEEAEPEEEQ
jgi:hypothetical protein